MHGKTVTSIANIISNFVRSLRVQPFLVHHLHSHIFPECLKTKHFHCSVTCIAYSDTSLDWHISSGRTRWQLALAVIAGILLPLVRMQGLMQMFIVKSAASKLHKLHYWYSWNESAAAGVAGKTALLCIIVCTVVRKWLHTLSSHTAFKFKLSESQLKTPNKQTPTQTLVQSPNQGQGPKSTFSLPTEPIDTTWNTSWPTQNKVPSKDRVFDIQFSVLMRTTHVNA